MGRINEDLMPLHSWYFQRSVERYPPPEYSPMWIPLHFRCSYRNRIYWLVHYGLLLNSAIKKEPFYSVVTFTSCEHKMQFILCNRRKKLIIIINTFEKSSIFAINVIVFFFLFLKANITSSERTMNFLIKITVALN